MKKLKIRLLFFVTITTLIFVFIIILNSNGYFSKPVLEESTQIHDQEALPFKSGEKFNYKVKYQGIHVGKIEWEYLGRSNVDDKLVDVLSFFSNIKILELFSIQSKEKLYIDSETSLPLKVERDVKSFGNQEDILEEYNQGEDYVKITKITAKGTKEKILHIKAPIHNVIALLYFFPQDVELKLGDTFSFNLPTQKISMEVIALEIVETPKGSYEAYVLEGRPRKLKVWLEKEKRIPLRIERPIALGKINIFID